LDKITIKRYDPHAAGYQGYIEPADRSWILYIGVDGSPLFFPHRAPDGGVLCEAIGPHNTDRIERPIALVTQ
jgi:hypothetical protein